MVPLGKIKGNPTVLYIIILKWDNTLSQTKRQKLQVACLWEIFTFLVIQLEWLSSLYLEFIKVSCTIIWLKLLRAEHFNELGTCWLLTVKSKKSLIKCFQKSDLPKFFCVFLHYIFIAIVLLSITCLKGGVCILGYDYRPTPSTFLYYTESILS